MASETDALLPRGPRVNSDEAEASAPAAAHAGPASGEEKEEEADSLTFGDRMLFSFPFLSLNLVSQMVHFKNSYDGLCLF